MYLDQLRVDHFRAYKAAELILPPQGIVLVVGANNTGKSALLSSLDMITSNPYGSYPSVGDERVSELLRHAGSAVTPRIAARFRLSPDEGSQFFDAMSPQLVKVLPQPEPPQALEWEFAGAFEKRLYPTALGVWMTGDTTSHELLRITHRGGSNWQYKVGGRNLQDSFWGEAQVPVPFRLIEDEEAFGVAENYWNDWRSRYYHLEPLRAGATELRGSW
jgi:energy-coupling factor transporter ATP-binding protein EcfA2